MDHWVEEYLDVFSKNSHHLDHLRSIIYKVGEPCEGNVFWNHLTTNIDLTLVTKQANLFHYGKDAQKILEIGFNAGHSCLLFLLANNTSKITIFDIGDHRYTKYCYEYLAMQFPGRLTIFYGDSRITVPEYIKNNPNEFFDLLHIDGGHEMDMVASDIIHCSRIANLSKNVVISDDDNDPTINSINRSFVEQGVFKEIASLQTFTYTHFIAKYIRPV